MGQTPSCIQPMNLPHKEPKLVAAYPDSQTMSSPRRSTQIQSINSTISSSKSSIQSNIHSTNQFSIDQTTSSPSNINVKRTLKALIVDDNQSQSTTTTTTTTNSHQSNRAGSLLSWLKEKSTSTAAAASTKPIEYLLETPKGSQANEFKHFCPICYRYFRSIYSTSCCAGNCCHECATNFISTRSVGIKFHPNIELDLPCPNCNQTNGVAFVALTQQDESKLYIESPRTQALLEQAQSRRQQEEIEHQRHEITA